MTSRRSEIVSYQASNSGLVAQVYWLPLARRWICRWFDLDDEFVATHDKTFTSKASAEAHALAFVGG